MTCKKCYATPAFLISGVLLLVVGALPAFGQTCIQDEYNSFNGLTAHPKTLSCTANDVSVSKVTGVSVIDPVTHIATPGGKCVSGTTFSFVADFTIQTTSSKTRSNIGLFFGTGASALTGSCSNAILTGPYNATGVFQANGVTPYVLGDPTYEELDGPINGEVSPTGCGDTSSNDGGGTGQQTAELEIDNVTCPLAALNPCPDPTITGTCMALPECTGWYQPANGMPVCDSPTHAWVPAATPGTTSKCNCTTLYIPIQLIQPSATVGKICTTGTANATKTNCDLGAEGGNETYQVTITNTTPASEGGIIVDQICDNRYGSIYDDGVPATRCPVYPAAGLLNPTTFTMTTTCNSSTPGDIANGGSGSCTFTVSHGENLSVTDQVTVAGHSDLATTQTFNPPASNTVTVTSSDAPTTATTGLGLAPGPVNACITLRYNVSVVNTSSADESITLNSVASPYVPALNASTFGDITTIHGDSHTAGSITGTTCGVDGGVTGQGTLSGVTAVDCLGGTVSPCNGGAFPQMLAAGTGNPLTGNGSYTCQFDGVICGTPGPIPADGSTCTEGLQVMNTKVTPNLTGDDPAPNADTITATANPFTAIVCLNQQ